MNAVWQNGKPPAVRLRNGSCTIAPVKGSETRDDTLRKASRVTGQPSK